LTSFVPSFRNYQKVKQIISKIGSLRVVGGNQPITSTTLVLTFILISVKVVSAVPSGGDKTYVHRENTDVKWVV
jgi:hypothetical protein